MLIRVPEPLRLPTRRVRAPRHAAAPPPVLGVLDQVVDFDQPRGVVTRVGVPIKCGGIAALRGGRRARIYKRKRKRQQTSLQLGEMTLQIKCVGTFSKSAPQSRFWGVRNPVVGWPFREIGNPWLPGEHSREARVWQEMGHFKNSRFIDVSPGVMPRRGPNDSRNHTSKRPERAQSGGHLLIEAGILQCIYVFRHVSVFRPCPPHLPPPLVRVDDDRVQIPHRIYSEMQLEIAWL